MTNYGMGIRVAAGRPIGLLRRGLFVLLFGLAGASASAQAEIVLGEYDEAPASVAVCSGCDVALYEPFELQVENPGTYTNPFDYDEIALEARFIAPSGREYAFAGYYDGDGAGGQQGMVWALRFQPDETGTWRYSYRFSDDSKSGDGSFAVGPRRNPALHGHVAIDPENPYGLRYRDGTPHYWWGGKWVNGPNYGPKRKGGQENEHFLDDATLLAYLDRLVEYDHNGILVKTALFPLADDKMRWDLAWIRRAEWLVREAAARGIYVHLNIFDTWSRVAGKWFEHDTHGERHVFNVWDRNDMAAERNYVRTIVARFAGFPNVYWELGNEMEHTNSGEVFMDLANEFYLPWIREADPHDLPIGLSEGIHWTTNVDIAFLHQTDRLPPLPKGEGLTDRLIHGAKSLGKRLIHGVWIDSRRPAMMNELVFGGEGDVLWKDEVMRDPASRYSYRRTFWRNFTYGGTGSTEATWLDISKPLDEAVLNVMADQQTLRRYIEALPVDINTMRSVGNWASGGPRGVDYSRTRVADGAVYVTYFAATGDTGATMPGKLTIGALPEGQYRVSWLDPRTLEPVAPALEISGGEAQSLDHPGFERDLLLSIVERSRASETAENTAGAVQ